jgi:hypothetical protein
MEQELTSNLDTRFHETSKQIAAARKDTIDKIDLFRKETHDQLARTHSSTELLHDWIRLIADSVQRLHDKLEALEDKTSVSIDIEERVTALEDQIARQARDIAALLQSVQADRPLPVPLSS